MATIAGILSSIRSTYTDRVKIPTLHIRDLRGSIGITSNRSLAPVTILLKRLCMFIKIELDWMSANDQRSPPSSSQDLCTIHLERIQRFDEQDAVEVTVFDEIDVCPECNETTTERQECIVKLGGVIGTISKQLSVLVHVNRNWIIFIVWYCYTQICSKNMLKTAGVIERVLLSADYETVGLCLIGNMRTSRRQFSQCPLL